MNRNQLSEIALKKREEIIKEFYESQKKHFEKSAGEGFTGCSVSFDGLEPEVKMALKVEENRLSEIITEVGVKLRRSRLISINSDHITNVSFSWE